MLYEKGSNAPGHNAENPGEHGLLIYNACAEFKVGTINLFGRQYYLSETYGYFLEEDLSQKRWKDALYGRYKELPDGIMKRPLQRTPKKDNVELNRSNSSLQQIPTHDPDS